MDKTVCLKGNLGSEAVGLALKQRLDECCKV
jgi:hypothetical protein